ncbi:hypothetical protein E1293_19205 [Actinomadura darangshiensis]|uniref:DUF4145 domain-containing protein n=1 Tax=Actinomadura darangshiensis TaxID=705336 RepID=A0A4R5B5P4_9ACTN|nr:hypothetical protein E1293_19205 [Actinomadura darangshiensis]
MVAEKLAPKFAQDEIRTEFAKLREMTRSAGFDLRPEFSSEGVEALVRVRLLPLEEPKIPLSEEITALEADFARLGLDVATTCYQQAVDSFVDGRFLAANGQLRSMFEAVVIHFAVVNGFNSTQQGDGGRAIGYLKDKGFPPPDDGGNFIHGLWKITHTSGPHPGTTDAGEVHFRMLAITGAARYLIDRFAPPTP